MYIIKPISEKVEGKKTYFEHNCLTLKDKTIKFTSSS